LDRFQELSVFVGVAELRGFAAAARALAMSPPAVTRSVSALEERIGTRLFVRTTRSVRLTESGQRLLGDAKRILADLQEAEEAAVGSHAAPRGEIHITAPVLFGRIHVTPILGDFLDDYPMVSARTLFVDRVVNLMDEGLDVAIRIGDLPDSSLTAVRAGFVRRVVFAAPAYLKKYGRPEHPQDLDRHRVIQSTAIGTAAQMQFREDGMPLSQRISPRLRMNSIDALIELVRRGWGISQSLSYQVAGLVDSGELEIVLEDFELPAWPVHVVHQEGRLVSARVRAFVDYCVDRLRRDPALR